MTIREFVHFPAEYKIHQHSSDARCGCLRPVRDSAAEPVSLTDAESREVRRCDEFAEPLVREVLPAGFDGTNGWGGLIAQEVDAVIARYQSASVEEAPTILEAMKARISERFIDRNDNRTRDRF